jgi:putative holliday junction resolvase
MVNESRILAVDPGEKRIGIAISDPTATLSNPLTVINHISLKLDSALIASLANENQAGLIIVGMPKGSHDEEIPQTRHALRLIEGIRSQTGIPVIGWDEWGSTQDARQALIDAGVSRSKRGGHQDSLAAAMILRSYIEANKPDGDDENE